MVRSASVQVHWVSYSAFVHVRYTRCHVMRSVTVCLVFASAAPQAAEFAAVNLNLYLDHLRMLHYWTEQRSCSLLRHLRGPVSTSTLIPKQKDSSQETVISLMGMLVRLLSLSVVVKRSDNFF